MTSSPPPSSPATQPMCRRIEKEHIGCWRSTATTCFPYWLTKHHANFPWWKAWNRTCRKPNKCDQIAFVYHHQTQAAGDSSIWETAMGDTVPPGLSILAQLCCCRWLWYSNLCCLISMLDSSKQPIVIEKMVTIMATFKAAACRWNSTFLTTNDNSVGHCSWSKTANQLVQTAMNGSNV